MSELAHTHQSELELIPALGPAVEVRASGPRAGQIIPQDGVIVGLDAVATLDLSDGDAVRVGNELRRVVAHVVVSVDPADSGLVRLGSLIWSQVGVKRGDTLQVSRAAVDEFTEVTLATPFRLATRVESRVRASLQGRALWPGAIVFAETLNGGGGIRIAVESSEPPEGIVGAPTVINFGEPRPARFRRRVSFADVGSLDHEYARLRELIELPLLAPSVYRSLGITPAKGVLMAGPPGTGKTLMARVVAAELGVHVAAVAAPDLIGSFTGETEAALRQVFQHAAEDAPSLILIDEVDVIAGNRDRGASPGDVRIASQLLTLMDGLQQLDGVVVLATTNRPWALDEAFRRPGRFDEELVFGAPDLAGRAEILSIHTRDMPLDEGARAALEDAVLTTAGYSGADLMNLARGIGLNAARRLSGGGRGFELSNAIDQTNFSVIEGDVKAAVMATAPSVLRGLNVGAGNEAGAPLVGLDEPFGLLVAEATRALERAPDSQGALLFGPPGNGKSRLVQLLAIELDVPLVQIDASTVYSQWLGESEAALRSLFDRAQRATPAILAIEQLDAIAQARTAGADHSHVRVISTLLNAIDGARRSGGLFVVGLTNRPELIDDAVVRSGRLGLHIEIADPPLERRRQIIGSVLSLAEPTTNRDFVEALAFETEGCSAAAVAQRARPL